MGLSVAGSWLGLVGRQVVDVDAGHGGEHPAVTGLCPHQSGVPGVRVQQQTGAGQLLRHRVPQVHDGLLQVRRVVLERAVEAGVEDPLPPALDVGEQAPEVVVAVLAGDRPVPVRERGQAVAVDVVEQLGDQPMPSSGALGAFRRLRHGFHLLNDGNIQCVCL
jgi:hypothetical protein